MPRQRLSRLLVRFRRWSIFRVGGICILPSGDVLARVAGAFSAFRTK